MGLNPDQWLTFAAIVFGTITTLGAAWITTRADSKHRIADRKDAREARLVERADRERETMKDTLRSLREATTPAIAEARKMVGELQSWRLEQISFRHDEVQMAVKNLQRAWSNVQTGFARVSIEHPLPEGREAANKALAVVARAFANWSQTAYFLMSNREEKIDKKEIDEIDTRGVRRPSRPGGRPESSAVRAARARP